MILADTSVWVDHLRRTELDMIASLDAGDIVMHPFVIGELALGGVPERKRTFLDLAHLPRIKMGRDSDVVDFIERWSLAGSGIGYVDAHLLVSVMLTPETSLWTRDRRLLAVAQSLSLATAKA